MPTEPLVCAVRRSGPRVIPPLGLVHCYDCGKDKGPDRFQLGVRGKPTSPCLPCRAIRLRRYVSDGRRPKTKSNYQTIKKWAGANPQKRSAHQAVQYALRKGQLVRKSCEVCGDPKSQAHHDDYSQKLSVRWLCARCHKKEHRKYAA